MINVFTKPLHDVLFINHQSIILIITEEDILLYSKEYDAHTQRNIHDIEMSVLCVTNIYERHHSYAWETIPIYICVHIIVYASTNVNYKTNRVVGSDHYITMV